MMERSLAGQVPLFDDAYAPAEIAVRVRDIGVVKANAPTSTVVALAILAGAFISLGALFYIVTMTPGHSATGWPFGPARLVGGVSFSLGLVLVIIGGAELFTGNNLLAMAWAAKRVTTRQVFHNWVWVYLGNFIGAFGTAVLVLLGGIHTLGDNSVGETMVVIARAEVSLDPVSGRGPRRPMQRVGVPRSVAVYGCPWGS